MEVRKLGNSALEVSALGLGCMSMSGMYGKAQDAESIAVIQHALALGITLLDTSNSYGWGHNEELLGKALAGRRAQVVLASKFGHVRDPSGGRNGVDGSPRFVQQACEDSLRRLKVDTIDLYYQHRVDPKVPIEETVGAMSRLMEQGKVRALGLSEAAPASIRRAHAVHPISAVQTEYSLMYRHPGEETLAVCRELAISLVAYSPLGRGFLAGRIRTLDDLPEGDRRHEHPRFRRDNFQRNRALVQRLEMIADGKGITPAQLVLAWLVAQGPEVIPLPGTKHKAHLEDNVGALKVTLTPEELRRIDEAMPPGAVTGTRYPEGAMGAVNI